MSVKMLPLTIEHVSERALFSAQITRFVGEHISMNTLDILCLTEGTLRLIGRGEYLVTVHGLRICGGSTLGFPEESVVHWYGLVVGCANSNLDAPSLQIITHSQACCP